MAEKNLEQAAADARLAYNEAQQAADELREAAHRAEEAYIADREGTGKGSFSSPGYEAALVAAKADRGKS